MDQDWVWSGLVQPLKDPILSDLIGYQTRPDPIRSDSVGGPISIIGNGIGIGIGVGVGIVIGIGNGIGIGIGID